MGHSTGEFQQGRGGRDKSNFTLHKSAWHHLKHQVVKINEQIV